MNKMTPHHVPSMGFCAGTLDRLVEERGQDALAAALEQPAARIFLLREGRWLDKGSAAAPDPHFSIGEARALAGVVEDAVLLGWTKADDAPRLALELPSSGDGAAEHPAFDLRASAMERALEPEVEAALGQAQHILNWHRRSRFCGRCGAPTRSAIGGYRRDCAACGQVEFPRTDPVVIMLVHDGAGRCVLARQRHFAPGMWSCLAGFLEPGETIEDAVRREVREEVGLAVGRVRYHASQPWPFPGSLMIGCIAEASPSSLTLQDSELEAGRWFSREELLQMIEERHPDGLTPPKAHAIAHHLVCAYLDDETGDAREG